MQSSGPQKKKESIQAAAWKSEALLKATLSTKKPA